MTENLNGLGPLVPASDVESSVSVPALMAGHKPDTLQLTVHEASKMSPRKTAAAQAALVESIRATGGPVVKIQATAKLEVFDGGHRMEALATLGWDIKLEWVDIHDISDAEAFERAAILNIERRDLNTSQKAQMAGDAELKQRAFGRTPKSVEDVAQKYGVSKRNVYHAMDLRQKDSQLADFVVQGALRINAAMELLLGDAVDRDDVVALLSQGLVNEAKAKLKEIKERKRSDDDANAVASTLFDAISRLLAIQQKSSALIACFQKGEAFTDDGRARNLKMAVDMLAKQIESGALLAVLRDLSAVLDKMTSSAAGGEAGSRDLST